MAIVPDTKDWTWVLDKSCPECGFDSAAVAYDDIPVLTRTHAALWPDVLARKDVRVRPDESTWSALEYGAHVRDVFRIFTERVELVRAQDNPTFANWDQDIAAIEGRYWEQDPVRLRDDVLAAGESAAGAFAAVPVADRGRGSRRSNGSIFTIDSLARYFVHDIVHHSYDVGANTAR